MPAPPERHPDPESGQGGPQSPLLSPSIFGGGIRQGKARQGKFIYIAHFIHSGNSSALHKRK